jgi:hypothetical protein
LFVYTNRVPVWLTGWERNPLAGSLGIAIMAALAIGFTQAWKWQTSKARSLQPD